MRQVDPSVIVDVCLDDIGLVQIVTLAMLHDSASLDEMQSARCEEQPAKTGKLIGPRTDVEVNFDLTQVDDTATFQMQWDPFRHPQSPSCTPMRMRKPFPGSRHKRERSIQLKRPTSQPPSKRLRPRPYKMPSRLSSCDYSKAFREIHRPPHKAANDTHTGWTQRHLN